MADFATLFRLIAPYRNDVASSSPQPKIDIGCIMISEPVFFEDDEFIPQPSDGPAQAVRGKALSLSEGEWTLGFRGPPPLLERLVQHSKIG